MRSSRRMRCRASKVKVNMSVLQKLIDTPGIIAACGGTGPNLQFALPPPSAATDDEREQWFGIFRNLVSICEAHKDQEEIKLILKDHSIVLRRSGDTYVGLVAEKGHPVIKSMQRMLRKSFRHFGARVPEANPRYRSIRNPAPPPASTPRVLPDSPSPDAPASGTLPESR